MRFVHFSPGRALILREPGRERPMRAAFPRAYELVTGKAPPMLGRREAHADCRRD